MPVIKVDNLSKKYILSHQSQQGYATLRDAMTDKFKVIGKRILRSFAINHSSHFDSSHEEFYALRDVSFEVEQGDRVGIIGRNGAGKSTLLKILSRIVEPTSGRVSIKGRVASLLEVGTGFHPELTGRENIYLNGAILGMSRAEIQRKFDEIVAFAEVEKFLDTPVKRYSSGMYVRLAFAVAAHLEPEILLVDEVLAVGDAAFQKKCLGKMQDVSSREGRTIFLVSHSMTTVQALANKALFLEDGKTDGITSVHDAVGRYLYGGGFANTGHFRARPSLVKDACILEAKILNSSGEVVDRLSVYESVNIEITWLNRTGVPVSPNFMLVNQLGINVMIASDVPIDWDGTKKKSTGKYVSRAVIPPNLLNANDYTVHIALDCSSPRVCYDWHLDALRFTLTDPMDERCLARGSFTHVREDVVLWSALEWSFDYENQKGP